MHVRERDDTINTYRPTYHLNVEPQKLSEVGRNIMDDEEYDPVVSELTEYQRKHRQ